MSIVRILKRFVADEHAREGITSELLGLVDLEVEYSPVIPFAGGSVDAAVEVRPWGFVPAGELPERFEVQHSLVQNPVDRNSLKVMRARYLLARDAYYGPILHHYFERPLDDHHAHDRSDRTSRPPAQRD